jgi:hypothetical protein
MVLLFIYCIKSIKVFESRFKADMFMCVYYNGHCATYNNTLTLWRGGQAQEVGAPRVADAIALEKCSNHTSTPGDEHRQGEGLWCPVQGRRECGTLGEIVWYLIYINWGR